MEDIQVEQALNYIRDHSKEYATAKANRVYLMEFRKSKKAILMTVAEKGGAKTVAAQEREAYASNEYQELLEGLRVAVENEEYLRYQLKVAELKFEQYRTKEASRRAEFKRYGN